jgi:hypothetical protein
MSEQVPLGEETSARAGAPVDAALFSRVEQLIQSVRLTQDERIAVETGGAASEVHTARKEFEMGHLDQSLRAVNRVSASFDQMVSQWENLARRREQQKQNMSMLQIRKMLAEHTGVRTRVQLVRAQIRRLRGGLDQWEKMAGSPGVKAERESPEIQERAAESIRVSAPPTIQGPLQLPPGFLESFQAARDPQGRTEVVRQYFEVAAKLEVDIRKEGGQDRVCFAPFSVPPMNRFYFLLDTAQIIRTRRAKIVDVVHVHYPDTGKNERMPLKDFVKHVRNGVWLLRPIAQQATMRLAAWAIASPDRLEDT